MAFSSTSTHFYFLWFLVLLTAYGTDRITSTYFIFSLVFGLTMAYCTDGAFEWVRTAWLSGFV